MADANKHKSKKSPGKPDESLENIIEKSKTSAEAYRKILNSLESKIKK